MGAPGLAGGRRAEGPVRVPLRAQRVSDGLLRRRHGLTRR